MEEFVQLKWNTHQLAFLENLSALRDKQVFTDVVLSCGDQFYPAHRLVLSSCSAFFSSALELSNCKSPVLLLHGIEQSTLEQLLVFMYDGQVTIPKNDLAKLMKAAQWLGVRGLDVSPEKDKGSDKNEDTNSSQILKSLTDCAPSENSSKTQERPENATKSTVNVTGVRQKKSAAENDVDKTSKAGEPEEETQDKKDWKDNNADTDCSSSVEKSLPDDEMRCNYPVQRSHDENSVSSFHGWEDEMEEHEESDGDELEEDSQTKGNGSGSPNEEQEEKASKENSSEDSKRSLRCKHCKKSFKVRKDLARHLRVHHDQTYNFCFSCHIKFISKKDFKDHLKSHKVSKKYPCTLCGLISRSYYMHKKHIRVAHTSSPSLQNGDILNKGHQKSQDSPTEAEQKEVTCPSCKMVFADQISVKEHLEEGCKELDTTTTNTLDPVVLLSKIELSQEPKATDRKKWSCHNCNKKFASAAFFQRHHKKGCKGIYESPKGFPCPYCPYIGTRLRSTEDHVALHTGDYRYFCSFCPYACGRPHLLRKHTRSRHPELL